MQKTCVLPPTTVELLDVLEDRIVALYHSWHSSGGDAETAPLRLRRKGKRAESRSQGAYPTHPFSRIEEL
jgi:hypothetical protein